MEAEQLNERGVGFCLLFLQLSKDGAFGNIAADEDAGDDQDEAEQERNPPAPGKEVSVWASPLTAG